MSHPRAARVLQKMTPGTMGGESRVATPVSYGPPKSISQPSLECRTSTALAPVWTHPGNGQLFVTFDSTDPDELYTSLVELPSG